MEPEPFFSIIMPTYNRANLIKRAIKSVIRQEFKDWELIIVDDGSVDNTQDVLQHIVKNNQKINIIKTKHNGHVKARNAGIKAARGKYVTFIDSDDEYRPNHLLTRYIHIKKNPKVDAIHGGIEVIGYPYIVDVTNPRKLIHATDCSLCGTIIVRRYLLLKLKGFSEKIKYGEDYNLIQRLNKNNANVVRLEIPTYRYYRDDKNSITRALKNKYVNKKV